MSRFVILVKYHKLSKYFIGKYDTLLKQMNLLDIEIQSVISELPTLIQTAKQDISDARKKQNYRLSAAASGIALGYLIQVCKRITKHFIHYNTTWWVLVNLLKNDFCKPGIVCKSLKDLNCPCNSLCECNTNAVLGPMAGIFCNICKLAVLSMVKMLVLCLS